MTERYLLGIDTSNYTCSAAVYDVSENNMRGESQMLPVKPGEKGVRQSDAVFAHTMLLPQILERLSDILPQICAVGVSDRPSCREGSYMPCFMPGLTAARAIAVSKGIRYFTAPHQTGHILAALYSADRLDLVRSGRRFIAFHVSGGTTDMLLCEPDAERLLKVTRIGGSSDLKAGQAIDRCGIMLGLSFPCGIELERLAVNYYADIKVRPTVRGNECSLSGLENKCRKLYQDGADKGYIAAFCLRTVEESIAALTQAALSEYGEDTPLIYAGGVMSDKLIADSLTRRFGAVFAAPEYSRDNAAGMAIYAAFMKGLI